MHMRGFSYPVSGLCLVLFLMGSLSQLSAQTFTCSCNEDKIFGSCEIESFTYPGLDPGCAVIVPLASTGGNDLLYVTDISDGFIYQFEYRNSLQTITCSGAECFKSPLPFGSLNAPDGITYNTDNQSLYWVFNNSLFRSDPDISILDENNLPTDFELVTVVNLFALANFLDLPQVGELGGITYNQSRSAFWGVDVVNNIYFEFSLEGNPVVEGERVLHFKNPLNNPQGGGAFGNSITYAPGENLSIGFFDIPIGSSQDGKVTIVERVYATDGKNGELPVQIGDPTGVYYQLDPFINNGDPVNGIAFWEDGCAPGRNVEVLLTQGNSSGEPSQIHLLTANAPVATGLAKFECIVDNNSVVLNWKVNEEFESLEITRTETFSSQTKTIVSLGAGEGQIGESSHLDPNVKDGVYEYNATLTTSDGQKFSPRNCRVVIGRGNVVASESYLDEFSPQDNLPFAITYIGSLNRILVADFISGNAHVFDTDLDLLGTFPGPFNRIFSFFVGTTGGVAWSSNTNEVFWLENREGGQNFLQRSTVVEEESGVFQIQIFDDSVRIQTPEFLLNPILGDIDYDVFANQFWAVDRRNGVTYSFLDSGVLSGNSFQAQLPNPRRLGINLGITGGGMTVVESSTNSLTLDWIVGNPGVDLAGDLDRVTYDREYSMQTETDNVQGSGEVDFSIDLISATNSRFIGGMVYVDTAEGQFQYVVDWNNATIFKLKMAEGLGGEDFRRGDANDDGELNLGDPRIILNFLFLGGVTLGCADAADVDNSENINLQDAVDLLSYLFKDGPPPPDPFTICGQDLETELSCLESKCQ